MSSFEPLKTHDESVCAPHPCVIHNPSDHHMRDWPTVFRMDRYALVERICPHGVGHPDIDSLDYFVSAGMSWQAVHACCGCCINNEEE